jgi:dTDP-4-dehydrorhamnose reductase
MNILVTGANGQVGSDFVKLAASQSLVVEATNADSLDITNGAQVAQRLNASRPDLVINAAAYTAVDRAEDEFDVADAVNRIGPEFLAQNCENLAIPFFHLSTDYVFDGSSDRPYLETDRGNPMSVYGSTKLAGDKAALSYEKSLVIRVSWVFGEHGNNFVKTMLRLGLDRDEMKVVDDQCGAPTWSGDIAGLLLELVMRYKEERNLPWGLYHYSGSPAVSWYQFAQEIFNRAGKLGVVKHAPRVLPIPSSEYPTRAIRPKNSTLDCGKIKTVFQIAQPNWGVGLEQVIRSWGNS